MNYKMQVIDPSKEDALFVKNGYYCLNLNALLKTFSVDNIDFKKIFDAINIEYLNLNNLASLCSKLDVRYDSYEVLDLIDKLVIKIKKVFPNITFVQQNIKNGLELDLKPYSQLHKVVSIEPDCSIIYIDKGIKNRLKYLGYMDSQINKLAQELKDLTAIIPSDLTQYLGLENKHSTEMYSLILELLRQ